MARSRRWHIRSRNIFRYFDFLHLGYEPSGESEWQESASGRLISHERLQAYLKRYQFI